MLVLALEASSRTYAVAVGTQTHPRAERAARRDDPAFAGLSELAARTLAAGDAAFSDIELIAVNAGPGGLSSIRAAVAYANGLAFSLGIKIFSISSLELMAIAAQRTGPGPILCLKRSLPGSTYAGLFVNGVAGQMRHGPVSSVVPEIAGGLETVAVAGASADDVAGLLPGVNVADTGIAGADVTVLYQTARAAMADPERLVPAASPINEASWIFHKPSSRR